MRTAEGEIGVLPGHIPVTVMMAPGVTHITKADGSIRHIAIHDGFVEIQPDKVSIMAEKLRFPVRESVSLIQVRIRILPAQDVHGPVPQLELNYLPESGKKSPRISEMVCGDLLLCTLIFVRRKRFLDSFNRKSKNSSA